ncbi:MAG: hypothetical protein J2P36_34380, partial [Ktedonobacteraceae bacterium]|nr:hypothetical protein [Ktedonobacteraceae bacterium]
GPGLLYQDNRAANETEHFIQRFGALNIHQRTGQTPSPFYVLPKLLWLKAQHSDWFRPGVAAVQPRDLVAWHLTGRLATEPTHAACTLAYDLMAGNWARDWLDELDLIQLSWPELLPSSSVQGLLTAEAAAATGLPVGTPVITGAADSLCAVYGAQAMAAGVLCEVTGTSTCLHLTVMQPVAAYTVNTYPHIEPGRWCAEVGLNTTGGQLPGSAHFWDEQQTTCSRQQQRHLSERNNCFFCRISRAENATLLSVVGPLLVCSLVMMSGI